MESKGQLTKTIHRSAVSLAADERSGAWNGGGYASAYQLEPEVRYGTILRRHARAIAAIMLLCLAAGLLVTFLMSPSYKAKTLLEVSAENQDFMNNKNIDPNASASTMDSYLETQTKLLGSETVADRVVASLLANASQYKDGRKGGFTAVREWLGWRQPQKSLESQIRKTLGTLKVKAEGQSSLISLTVSGPSPEIAADTANAVANQHMAVLQDARWASVTQTSEFLGKQVEALRRKLQTSEDQLQEYARTKGLIYTSDTSRESVVSEKLRAIQQDLEKAEADRTDKQSQLELANSSSPDALPRVLDDGSLREDKSRLTDLRRQLADLSATLTPNHYKVKEIESQIASLEKQADQERAAIVTRIQNDYRAAARREQLQRDSYERQLGLVTDQSGKEIRYNILKREVDANRDLYQSMLQRIKEAGVVSALRASNIRIVDPAKTPLLPDQPNLLLNTGIALLLGCMFSVLFVLMRERADRSIRAPGETSRLLQVPELAIIPSARRDIRTQIVSNSSRIAQAFTGSAPKRLAASGSDLSTDLLTNSLQTGSIVAESFRSAVTSILLWGREEALAHKVLVVTSAHSGAGKTTSVLNLGLGLVESGRRVLLIDGDLRLPRLGRIFGLETASGLSDILAERLAPSVARELIRDTGLPGLCVLPSGSRHRNAPQMLHSIALEKLLVDMRPDFDFILIDSPPALPLTDARLLAQHADGVILVFRAGETSAEQSLAVRKSFAQDGTYVFGSILNGWDAHAEDPAYVNSYLKYAG